MASLKITHFWSNLLVWGYRHIFQFDGTIEWKATEQSEGASRVTERSKGASRATERSKGASRATERSKGASKVTERSEGASKKFLRVIHYHLPMHCTLRYGTLLMVPQAKLSYGCTR